VITPDGVTIQIKAGAVDDARKLVGFGGEK
jgi:hypothetical protein